MRDLLNKNTLFNTVAMLSEESGGLLLVLEGPDDHLLLKEFVTPELQLIAATGGREQVLGAAKLAHTRHRNRVRFLVDRDYDNFSEEKVTRLDNVFVSDHHDCFMDLLAVDPSLLQRVIEVNTASARRRERQAINIPDHTTIENRAVELASVLAATRIVSTKLGLAIDFKRFKFGGIKPEDFKVDRLTRIVLTRTQYRADDWEEVISEVAAFHGEVLRMDPIPVGDHDLFSATSHVLRQHDVHVTDDNIQRGYILKTTLLAVSGTGWYQRIQKWCKSHGKKGFAEV